MKKGFTLIELLAVIVILAVILVIAVPSISNMIDSVKLEAYTKDEQMMIRASKNYIATDESNLPINIGETAEIKLSQLQASNFISAIKDPKNNNVACDGYILITKIASTGYDYTPYLKCGDGLIADGYINDGLVAYWKLDANAYDYSPSKNNGNISGAVPVADRFANPNKALSFDGIDDYVALNPTTNITTNRVTVSAWINLTSLSGSPEIFNKDQWDGGPWSGIRFRSLSGVVNLKLGDGTSNPYECSAGMLSSGVWKYVVGVWDGSYIRIYIDGNEAGKCQKTFTYVNSPGAYFIGKYAGSSYYFSGSIDDVRIYNRALSSSEIKLVYQIENKVGR